MFLRINSLQNHFPSSSLTPALQLPAHVTPFLHHIQHLIALLFVGTGTTSYWFLCTPHTSYPAKTAAGSFWNTARHFDGCSRLLGLCACIGRMQIHPLLTPACKCGPQQSPKQVRPWHRAHHLACKEQQHRRNRPTSLELQNSYKSLHFTSVLYRSISSSLGKKSLLVTLHVLKHIR